MSYPIHTLKIFGTTFKNFTEEIIKLNKDAGGNKINISLVGDTFDIDNYVIVNEASATPIVVASICWSMKGDNFTTFRNNGITPATLLNDIGN
jgi:hypothetical protein